MVQATSEDTALLMQHEPLQLPVDGKPASALVQCKAVSTQIRYHKRMIILFLVPPATHDSSLAIEERRYCFPPSSGVGSLATRARTVSSVDVVVGLQSPLSSGSLTDMESNSS
mmetsp:Transcript_13638/g.25046  ORF Transcript_13638/g.25046 Transcript_13638/m.25046 type:complete len:113 (-) Transcript_13638:365-703(-)